MAIQCFKNGDFVVEIETLMPQNISQKNDGYRTDEIRKGINASEDLIRETQSRINELSKDIENLTNHADGLDYAMAVIAGIVSGIWDIYRVGEWNFKEAKEASYEETNRKVTAFAKENGYEGKRLEGAINKLEDKFPLLGDNTFKGNKKNKHITPGTHHLDDLCHHPTIVGFICCLIVQYRHKTIYVDRTGKYVGIPVSVGEDGDFYGTNPATMTFAGIINWVKKSWLNWKGHLYSDMAGSSGAKDKGVGLPGPLLATLKEIISIPGLSDVDAVKKLHETLTCAFTNGFGDGEKQVDLGAFNVLFEGAKNNFDMRTENAIKSELKRQSNPVKVNIGAVCAFYFLRRVFQVIRDGTPLKEVNWREVIPFRNRTSVRMLTIATGVFSAIDAADAAIRAAIKTGGVVNPEFWRQFVLRINFVGLGGFAVAVGTDAYMGMERRGLVQDRIYYVDKELQALGAVVCYKEANMWIVAEDTGKELLKTYEVMNSSLAVVANAKADMDCEFEKIKKTSKQIEKQNPWLIAKLKKGLE